MQVKRSAFLQGAKPLLQELIGRLSQRYGYVSVLAADTRGKFFNVANTGVNAGEEDLFTRRGFVLKVYDGRSYGEYSFTHMDEAAIPAIVAAVEERLMPLEGLPEGLSLSEYGQIPDEPATLLKCSEYAIDPDGKGDEAILSALTAIREEGKARDERIVDCAVGYTFQEVHKLFLSPHRDLEQNFMWSDGYIEAMCPKEDDIVCYMVGASDLGGAEVLDQLRGKLDEAVRGALELIDSEPMVPGEYECVCTPAVTGMIVHEAFGHGVEMDMFVKDRAQAKQFIGEYVASPLITMHDGAAVQLDTGSYFFDDEGVLAHDTVIIEPELKGREVTCAQLGDEALPPILIEPVAGDFFDYESKYRENGAREICPAPLPADTIARIQELTLKACNALGLEGYGRCDFILGADGGLTLLEVNTLPGMTPASLVPKEAKAIGLDFPALLTRLMELGFKRAGKPMPR